MSAALYLAVLLVPCASALPVSYHVHQYEVCMQAAQHMPSNDNACWAVLLDAFELISVNLVNFVSSAFV